MKAPVIRLTEGSIGLTYTGRLAALSARTYFA